MTSDEIRKLLGGYATNTLTEAERKALLEAALDDQELFDALHQEQALKDLLDDPISREQIRQAVEKPIEKQTAWWTRWWAWTGAASAVAAVVLIVAVTRSHPPELRQMASLEAPKPATTAPQPAPAEHPPTRARLTHDSKAIATTGANKEEPRFNPPPPPPPAATAAPAAPVPPTFTSAQQAQLGTGTDNQQSQNQVLVTPLRDQGQMQTSTARLSAAISGVAAPVSFTLVKRDQLGAFVPVPPDAGLASGDAVRLTVAPAVRGYLSLSRQESPGEWTRVFPETGPGLAVNANAVYTVPDSPIVVSDTDQKLRLTLVPTSIGAGSAGGAVKARSIAGLQKQSAPVPFVVDLTIGPKNGAR